MKKDYYLFWIISSRGTNDKAVYVFKAGTPKEDVKEFLEQWCSTFGCWESSGNFISYGMRKVKIPARRELLKQYDGVCKRKNTIEDKWKVLAAMLNPRSA